MSTEEAAAPLAEKKLEGGEDPDPAEKVVKKKRYVVKGPPPKEVWDDIWNSYYKFTIFMVCLAPITYHFVRPWIQDPVRWNRQMDRTHLENTKLRCGRPKWHQGTIRKPEDVNKTMDTIFDFHGSTLKYRPELLSRDPWIVQFHNFMNQTEVDDYVDHIFLDEEKAHKWKVRKEHENRHVETHYCVNECDDHDTVNKIRNRTATITRGHVDSVSFVQAVRYRKGMYYKRHHDNHPTFHLLPAGVRLYTMLVYLEAPTEGGETYFPALGLKVTPKAGSALLFVNTNMKWIRGDLHEAEDHHTGHTNNERVDHEGLEVIEGEKKALNIWVYQWNYRDAWKKGCTSSELADNLYAHYTKGIVPPRKKKKVHDTEL